MQVAFSLSQSSTFTCTCTTPVKPYKLQDFPGVVQVNVLEWLKKKQLVSIYRSCSSTIFLGVYKNSRLIKIGAIWVPKRGTFHVKN
jgi:hypothetical protein